MNKGDFGKDFKWGVATSAYQIEGAYQADGKGPSIWDTFSQTPGKIAHGQTGHIACDHYHHWEKDLELVKTLNVPCYRFSISWPRIMPTGVAPINQPGIDFYNKIIDKCLKLGIEPWITLYHWDLPQALEDQGGWTNREIIHWFEEYVKVCIESFGDRVKHWMVLNEPFIFTGAGYFTGLHAPGLKGMKNYLPAVHHAALCQGIGGKVIRSISPEAEIGTTYSCSYFEAFDRNLKNVKTAERFDMLFNFMFLELAHGNGYPYETLPILKKIRRYIKPEDNDLLKFNFDFIGIQNYTREIVKYNFWIPYLKGKIIPADQRRVPHTEMNWEVYPRGIYELIRKYSSYKNVKKIIITENGAAFRDHVNDEKVNDIKRQKYLAGYLHETLNAQKEGYPVAGYFVWSLLDNLERNEGFEKRFGIVHVDHGTQERIIKASGHWYKDFLS